AFTPVHFETDREVLDAALAILGTRPPEQSRVLRIRNTLEVEELEVSEACLAEPTLRPGTVAQGRPRPLTFDPDGNLPPLQRHHQEGGRGGWPPGGEKLPPPRGLPPPARQQK